MRLVQDVNLEDEFCARLSGANQVDFAVAWARSSNPLEQLQAAAKRGVRIRAIVGLSGNHTHPVALRTLQKIGEIRIADGSESRRAPGGIFHPKVFLFSYEGDSSLGWVGSPNLTDGGFVRNSEAVWEISAPATVAAWFESLWDKLPSNSAPAIEAYEKAWLPPAFTLPSKPNGRPAAKQPDFAGKVKTWPDYLAALAAADAFWLQESPKYDSYFSVLGEHYSWVETIRTVGELARRESWLGLSEIERWTMLGMVRDIGSWGLLGSMKGAGRAKQIFRGATTADRNTLSRLRKALVPFIAASGIEQSVSAAVRCLRAMMLEKGISHGVATRIMACVRPDLAVSVNAGSAPGLGLVAGLPQTAASLGRPENYERLLRWLVAQPWYAVPRPADHWEGMLWDMRAALIDSLVYDPV